MSDNYEQQDSAGALGSNSAAVTTGTIVGTTAGAIAGSALGTAASVGGAAVGGTLGAIAGKAFGSEDEQQRQFEKDPYADNVPNTEPLSSYDMYRHGREAGVFGYTQFGRRGVTFSEAEDEMIAFFEHGAPSLSWAYSRSAAMDAWERLANSRWNENEEHESISPVCDEEDVLRAKAT